MKLAVVEAWHDALQAGDLDAVVALTEPLVEVGGPRGSARGHAVLRGWAGSAGITLRPRAWYCGAGDEVVVVQDAAWPAAGPSQPIEVATHFTVAGDAIARIVRHDRRDSALAAAGLAPSDEVRDRG